MLHTLMSEKDKAMYEYPDKIVQDVDLEMLKN
jgi:hypothetical protein